MTLTRTLSLAIALGLAAGAASAQTVGSSMASGRMSQAAAEQFVAGSGYNVDEARDMSLSDIAFQKWGTTNND